MTYYFTSITANYFAKARVLCKSLKKYNKDAKFILGISDSIPDSIDLKEEPFDDVIESKNLKRIGNKDIFFFKHTVTELCTAVKPMIAYEILQKKDADSVIYLDPDIVVFDNLKELEKMFDEGSILLTPHQLVPETEDTYIRENEILFLKRGTYNFGFFGVKKDEQGLAFLNWWTERLENYCFDDNYDVLEELSHDGLLGLFTDQKWADLIPSYFDRYKIIREPGYNVCTWNLSGRKVKISKDGKFFINEKPLYFYHFSGFDSGGHHNELKKSLEYYPQNKDVQKLSCWYEEELKQNGQKVFEKIIWNDNSYSNGELIKNFERKLLHIRKDVYHLFVNPYEVTDGLCFYNWVRKEYKKYFVQFEKKEKEEGIQRSVIKGINFFFPLKSKRRWIAKKVYKKIYKKLNN